MKKQKSLSYILIICCELLGYRELKYWFENFEECQNVSETFTSPFIESSQNRIIIFVVTLKKLKHFEYFENLIVFFRWNVISIEM